MALFGLGKKRSKYGKFIDSHGIKQEKLREVTKISRDTLWRACNDDEYQPRPSIKEALAAAARQLTGKNVKSDDFWM